MTSITKLVFFSSALLLAACGGSSSSDSSNKINTSDKNIKGSLALNKPLTGTITSQEDGTVYFPLQSKVGKTFTFNVEDLAINKLNIYAQAFDANFNPTSKKINILYGKVAAIDFKAVSDVSYLGINGATGNVDYRFKITALPNYKDNLLQNSITFEPNNSFNTSVKAKVGSSFNSTLSRKDEEDFYVINLEQNQKIKIKLTNRDTYFAAPSVWFRVYDAMKQPVSARKRVGNKDSNFVEVSADTASKFYVKLDTGGTPYDFRYTLSFEPTS